MDVDDLEAIIQDIEYREGYGIIHGLLARMSWYIQVHGPGGQAGRKWYISPHMCRSEVVQTCLAAFLAYEEHEAREHFRYRGQAVYGPHKSVDAMVDSPVPLEVRG